MKLSASQIGELRGLAEKYKVPLAALLAVIEVESNGVIYASGTNNLPVIRWEGHYFYKFLKGAERDKAVAKGLASPNAGGVKNPAAQEARYRTLLNPARLINNEMAYRSISIGVGQVMGSNAKELGFVSAKDMFDYAAMGFSGQVEIMLQFILVNGLIDELQRKDWSAFARAYNGKNYAKNKYDENMAKAYARWVKDPMVKAMNVEYPESGSAATMLRMGAKGAAVRDLQQLLVRSGATIKVDGDFGPMTKGAVMWFQQEHGNLDVDGVAGPETYAALARMKAPNEKLIGQQAVTDLEETKQGGAGALAGVGLAAAADKLNAAADKLSSATDTFQMVSNGMYAVGAVLVTAGVLWGVYGWLKSKKTYEGMA